MLRNQEDFRGLDAESEIFWAPMLARSLERERTTPSVLRMVKNEAKKDVKKKVPKKKLPWAQSEVKLIFAQLMVYGPPHTAENPKPTKSNYNCENFYLTPKQWVAKAGVDIETKTAKDVHQFVLQLLDAAGQMSKDERTTGVPSDKATSSANGSGIAINAAATPPRGPEASAEASPGARQ